MSLPAAEAAPGARRWLVVGALFVITYGMATPLASFGVFLPILAERFGWSRGAISAALSINFLVGGVAGFAAGALADRYGPRVILVVTVIFAGTAFALVSAVGALWQLYDVTGSYPLPFGAAPAGVALSWGLFALATSRRREQAAHRRLTG